MVKGLPKKLPDSAMHWPLPFRTRYPRTLLTPFLPKRICAKGRELFGRRGAR